MKPTDHPDPRMLSFLIAEIREERDELGDDHVVTGELQFDADELDALLAALELIAGVRDEELTEQLALDVAMPCRVCRRVDYAPEFCDGHTEDVISLAEMIGAAIWGGDPCPDENLVAHLDDAAVMIASGAERRLGDPEWRVVQWGDDEYELSGLEDRSWSIIQVGDRLWGLDPNEEGPGVPRRLDELLADLL